MAFCYAFSFFFWRSRSRCPLFQNCDILFSSCCLSFSLSLPGCTAQLVVGLVASSEHTGGVQRGENTGTVCTRAWPKHIQAGKMEADCLIFQKGRAECSLWIQLLVLDVIKNWKVVELESIGTNYQCGPWL